MNYNKLSIEEFEAILIKEFPEMYKNMNSDEYVICLAYGLETPTGWNSLIYILSKKIYKFCKDAKIDFPIVAQVKEKFGGLRFYLESSTCKEIDDFISEAEHISYYICYKCGMFYDITKEHNYLCEDCSKNRR